MNLKRMSGKIIGEFFKDIIDLSLHTILSWNHNAYMYVCMYVYMYA